MKKVQNIVAVLGIFAALLMFIQCGGPSISDTSVGAGLWPVADQIYFDVKMQEDIGIKDVAEAKSDIFLYGVAGGTFKSLPDDIKSNVDVYNVASSYWSLITNPYPNKAPYTGVVEGKTLFNPMAVREIRFALNFLINRKQIVDEILAGAGSPQFTPVTPGQPNSSRFDLIANKAGFTTTGNEAKAIADITAAMEAAAALPENAGKLKKDGAFWTFAGEPVTIKFLIRVDDPNGRLKSGRYIADQIEKAGIKVERLEYDRKKCISTAYQTNPADLQWGIYTEGWGAGQTYAFWEGNLAQMYAPWYSNMPGNQESTYWNYGNADLDTLTQEAVNGRFSSAEAYYDKVYKSAEIGIKEAVRIFVASQESFYAASSKRFDSRMVYGLGDGLNKLSLYSANVKPESNGKRILRVSQFSAKGTLFSGAWDPIGVEGFNDLYATNLAQPLTDFEAVADPVTGLYYDQRVTTTNVKTDFAIEGDKLVGKLPVDPKAVIWNARTQKWEAGIAYVDNGDGTYDYKQDAAKTSYSTGTYKYNGGKWHHGRDITVADFLYASSFAYDASVKKSETDLVYEGSYAGTANPGLIRNKGWVLNSDGSITTYFDVNFPMDPAYLAAQGGPGLNLKPDNRGVFVSWEVAEALRLMVAEGGASATKWTYGSAEGLTEVDVLSEACVKDIIVKLTDMSARKHVPAALAGYVSADDAVNFYKLTLDFITKYGHAYISNGGYYLERYDPTTNSAILTAFRDGYPQKGGYVKNLATSFPRIDVVTVPAYEAGSDLKLSAIVSEVLYPANKASPAAKADVKVTLIGATETVYTASSAKAGSFEATIPATDIASLKAGTYTVIIEAALNGGSPAVQTASIVVN